MPVKTKSWGCALYSGTDNWWWPDMALSHRKSERARWYIATAIRVTDSYQPIVARSTVAVTNQSHMQLDHYSNVTQISRSNPLIVSIFAETACHVPRSLRAGRPLWCADTKGPCSTSAQARMAGVASAVSDLKKWVSHWVSDFEVRSFHITILCQTSMLKCGRLSIK